MSDEIICIGYDPGFNANKIARVQGNEILTYVLPSSVGEPNRGNKDGLTLAGVVRPQRAPLATLFGSSLTALSTWSVPTSVTLPNPSTGWISTASRRVPNCEPLSMPLSIHYRTFLIKQEKVNKKRKE